MRTDAAAAPVALLVFAHQDDEFGLFAVIEACRRRGQRVVCAYLTHGAGGSAARRNAESLRVLTRLGVDVADVLFAGDQLGIADATLPRHMAAAGAWLARWLGAFDNVDLICAPAWEGGHHDHDALHFLTARTAHALGLGAALRQYALYNAWRCPPPLFRVLSPLALNGPVERHALSWGARLRYLRLCLQYPSQLTTWIGLFPFVLLHYALRGEQTLQPVALERLAQRPHAGPLYYERRGFYTWRQMRSDMAIWLDGPPPP
jgi:LmbE family N-acetylglucosaminyl deacetylase